MRYEDAEKNFELALRSASALNGQEHVDTAETEARLGQFFSLTSRNSEAIRHLKRALDVCLRLKGMDDPLYTPHILYRYSEALINSGHLEEGLASISRVVENQRKNRPGTRFLGEVLTTQASVLEDLGEYEKARLCLEEAASIAGKIGFKLAGDYATARVELALDLKKPDDANALINGFYGSGPLDQTPLSLDLLRNFIARSRVALAGNDAENAQHLASGISRRISESPNREYLKVWQKRAALAEGVACLQQHYYSQALPLLRRAAQLDQEMYDSASAELIPSRVALAAAYLEAGNRSESVRLLALAETVHKHYSRLGERFEGPLRELRRKLQSQIQTNPVRLFRPFGADRISKEHGNGSTVVPWVEANS